MTRPLTVLFALLLTSPALAQQDLGRLSFKPYRVGDVIELERSLTQDDQTRRALGGRSIDERVAITRTATLRARILEVRDGLPDLVALTIVSNERRRKPEGGEETSGGPQDALVGKTFFGLLGERGEVLAFDKDGALYRGPAANELRSELRGFLGAAMKQGLTPFFDKALTRGAAAKLDDGEARAMFRDGGELGALTISGAPTRIEAGDGLPRLVFTFKTAFTDHRFAPVSGSLETSDVVSVDPGSGRVLLRSGEGQGQYAGRFNRDDRGVLSIAGTTKARFRDRLRYDRADVKDEARRFAALRAAYLARPRLRLNARPLAVDDAARLKTTLSLNTRLTQPGQPPREAGGAIRSEARLTVLARDALAITRARLILDVLGQERQAAGADAQKRQHPLQGAELVVSLDDELNFQRDGELLDARLGPVLASFNLCGVGQRAPRPQTTLARLPIAIGETIPAPAELLISTLHFLSFGAEPGTLTLARKESVEGEDCAVFKVALKGSATGISRSGEELSLTGSIWIGLSDALVRRAELEGSMAVDEPVGRVESQVTIKIERAYTRK